MEKYINHRSLRFLRLGVILPALALQFTACNTYKNIPYFQDVSSDSASTVYKEGLQINKAGFKPITIQTNDILNVSIQTIDPQLSNIMTTADNGPSSLDKSGNAIDIPGYLVDKDGMIELPLAGKIKVGGLTTADAKEHIREKALQFYKDPVVNVRIANFKVTVIGEVAHPGSYLINGEKATILDAIGEAGDLTIFGIRKNILLSRNENGTQTMVRFDLTRTDIYQSPYFYLRQGDVIYVQPDKSKAATTDGKLARTYTLIGSGIALLIVIFSRLR